MKQFITIISNKWLWRAQHDTTTESLQGLPPNGPVLLLKAILIQQKSSVVEIYSTSAGRNFIMNLQKTPLKSNLKYKLSRGQ